MIRYLVLSFLAVVFLSNPVVAQDNFGDFLGEPFVISGIVAAAVAVPVAIHNSNDDTEEGSLESLDEVLFLNSYFEEISLSPGSIDDSKSPAVASIPKNAAYVYVSMVDETGSPEEAFLEIPLKSKLIVINFKKAQITFLSGTTYNVKRHGYQEESGPAPEMP